METIIARKREIQILQSALQSPQAELIAVYGRRRVGKTFLIRNVYENDIVVEFSGIKQVGLAEQLESFVHNISEAFYPDTPLAVPQTWLQAFRLLGKGLETRSIEKGKLVIFFDEFPWFETPKSNFLAAFDHFWNTWASRRPNIVVVICGSAASWMIQNVVGNKGGLHNRLTQRIRLLPFNLAESAAFLRHQGVILDPYSLTELYMAVGGVPQYLKIIRAGDSVAQAIDRACFTNDGWLRDEYKFLYAALYDHPEKHHAVIHALADKGAGLTRTEIMNVCKFSSGGGLTRILDELIESGFIAAYLPFGKTNKEVIYKLCDEFSLFYLKFMENSKASGTGAWAAKADGASWHSWSGFAFENLCLKHVDQIKKALGISGVYTEQSAWRYSPKEKDETGVQIDLLIDRKDNCINLIEIKFYKDTFVIDKGYAAQLRQKRQVFTAKTRTRKSIFFTFLSVYGAKTNEHYLGTIQNQLTIEALMEEV